MSRTFIYARVSTSDQHADNQIHEIEAAGFRAIGITDLMNSEEMESALISVIQNN